MTIAELLLLSVALAMDCFTVSIVNGVIVARRQWVTILSTALLFGLFQALMPLLGWMATSHFARYIEDYDHWVAFGLLAFLGLRMIKESGEPEEEHHLDPTHLSTQLLQAVATSIDALAVGISMAVTGYTSAASLLWPLTVIGIGSLLFSVAGFLLGLRFGSSIRRRLRPELFGGLILLFIGVRILLTHLFL
ncbi:MAG: manganese efflux pump [Prevotella sp.]|nr:manganese efflux pump [Prevotella sp.]MBQ9558783.1 manganese efflux pump [Bacteroidaceae bacterium]